VPAATRRLDDAIVGRPVLFGADRMAILRRRVTCVASRVYSCSPDGRGQRVALTVTFGRTRGAPGPVRLVDRFTGGGAATIAGNARGQLAIVYTELRGRGGIVWLAERRAGHAFGRPVAIRRGLAIGKATVAVGERGDVLVAYERGYRVETRLRRGSGRFGRPDDLGSANDLSALHAAVAPPGNAVVAYERAQIVAEHGIPPVITSIHAAVRPRTAARFELTRRLERGELVEGGIRMAAARDGTVTLAWNGATGLQVQRTARSGRLGAPQAPPLGMELSDLAMRPDGTAVCVGGVRATAPGGRLIAEVVAALRGPHGEAGPREVVAVESGDVTPVVAFDPRSGQPVVVWLAGGGDRRVIARFASRSG
jgi:hypothetical protein